MTFTECVMECAGNSELVAEFDRLSGSNLSLKGAKIELMIDEATGRLNAELAMFVSFVYERVWTRIEP